MRINSSHIYFLTMTSRVVNLCINNQVVVLTLPAFNDLITDLIARKALCDGYMLILQNKTLGITSESLQLKKDISTNYGVACKLVSAYGASIGNDTLKNIKMFNFSELVKTKPEELKISLATILKIIDDNKVALVPYGMSPAFITSLIAYQTSLSTTAHDTKNAIDVHKTTNELFEEELSEMQKIYTEQVDPLAEFFKLNSIPFYKLYKAARKVPYHHIHDKTPVPPDPTVGTLALSVMNNVTGQPIENVNLSILSINYTADTDVNGEITNPKLLAGEYSGTLTLENFTTIEFTFTIKLGEVTEIGFLMNPIPTTK